MHRPFFVLNGWAVRHDIILPRWLFRFIAFIVGWPEA